MSESLREEGMTLIKKGRSVLERDVEGAARDSDFDMVVRRAQEAVELTLKGALKIFGVDYPKIHDVAPVFSAQLEKKAPNIERSALDEIERISLWLAQARAPAFYGDQRYGVEDANKAARDAQIVVIEVERMLGLASSTDPLFWSDLGGHIGAPLHCPDP